MQLNRDKNIEWRELTLAPDNTHQNTFDWNENTFLGHLLCQEVVWHLGIERQSLERTGAFI